MKTTDDRHVRRTRMALLMVWVALFTLASACQSQSASVPEQAPTALSSIAPDSATAAQTVLTFLTWYKKHIQAANRIPLVNQQAGKRYSVNMKNGERYLAYLKSSQLLTDSYLNGWQTFFKESQEGFRLIPQTEGPPTGFDYDLVMLNQDADMQLASLKSLKIKQVKIDRQQASVTCVLFDTYEFRLVRDTNKWLINEILNLSQE